MITKIKPIYSAQTVSLRPRILITALRGGAGKTIISLGLISAWREMGYLIAPFKKGPDFIDAGWHSFAAGRDCHNLDPFLMNPKQMTGSFISHSKGADILFIEGNRGLYDGMDIEGKYSTAELAKLLNTPVLIVLDVTMSTRTMAAVIKGCQVFDPDLHIAGVILNHVAGKRQENLIKEAIEGRCSVPVVGSIPKLKENLFPERHMGLVPFQERDVAEKAIQWAKQVVRDNLALDVILDIATKAGKITGCNSQYEQCTTTDSFNVKIGIIMDSLFWFYYPENIQALKQHGAQLVEINSLSDKTLPLLDALYIGGGFPETKATALADNLSFKLDLKRAIETGLPVYAECGGLMYLGNSLIIGHQSFPMVGALPLDFVLKEKPQGHGYTVLEVIRENPYFPVDKVLRGHEFHYSKPYLTNEKEISFAFNVKRGHGIDQSRDGICKKNLLATYTHLHAGGNNLWANGFCRMAYEFKRNNKKTS